MKGTPMRYDFIHDAVKLKQPKAIAEIGTWNGRRALAMLNQCPTAKYYGFDLFEDATPETDRVEFNVKRHNRMTDVFEYLTGFDVMLYKGNTRETLKTFNQPVDFVWLDGGHSIETIQSDWDNIKRCLTPDAWVFFDDYFTGGIDTERIGCNKIVETMRHELIPILDPVTGGGFTQAVRVWP
jgi:predicted O-methyltransferase YrrM